MDENFGAPISGETEARISHFIPPVELKGSRCEKLQKLDTLIVYLQQLRQALGDTTKALNGGDGHRFIVSCGLGFSY